MAYGKKVRRQSKKVGRKPVDRKRLKSLRAGGRNRPSKLKGRPTSR